MDGEEEVEEFLWGVLVRLEEALGDGGEVLVNVDLLKLKRHVGLL
jgi:hypothetical protein